MKRNLTIEEAKQIRKITKYQMVADLLLQKKEPHNILVETKSGYCKKVGLYNAGEIIAITTRKNYQKAIMPQLEFKL